MVFVLEKRDYSFYKKFQYRQDEFLINWLEKLYHFFNKRHQ